MVLCLLALPPLAYFLAVRMMGGIDAYRSPLSDNPPLPGPPVGDPLSRRVIFVLVDGLRYDVAVNPEVMPFLNELAMGYGSAKIYSRAPSYSSPAYAVLFTGAWQPISDGTASNLPLDDQWAWTQDHLFRAAHHQGWKTAISGYHWFENFIQPEFRDASFFTPEDDEAADREVFDAALPWVVDPSYVFVVIHLDQVDYAGHYQGGGASSSYAEAAKRVDAYLREIAMRLDLGRDTLLVTSDHGHLNRGGHGGPEAVVTTQPFVLAGAGAANEQATIEMVDVAPTIAALLGLPLPASTQGRPAYKLLSLTPEQENRLRNLSAEQQERLRLALEGALGRSIEVNAGSGDPAQALDDALVDAMDPWFTWRMIGSGLILFALIVVWVLRKGALKFWALLGVPVYALFFHEIYSVALGRTYSLSSAASQADLLATILGCAAISFLWTIGIIFLAVRWWAGIPAHAGWFTFEVTLAVISGLFLPVLVHFAWNGLIPSRFLPEYWTLFLALAAMIQMLLVPPLGLILSAGFLVLHQLRIKRAGPVYATPDSK